MDAIGWILRIVSFLFGAAVVAWALWRFVAPLGRCKRKGCIGKRRSLTMEETREWVMERVEAQRRDPAITSTYIAPVTSGSKVPLKCVKCGEISYLNVR